VRKDIFITKTIQPSSWVSLSEANKKPETDNMSLILSVFDSLNNLYEKLSRLNYVLERIIIKHNLYQKSKKE